MPFDLLRRKLLAKFIDQRDSPVPELLYNRGDWLFGHRPEIVEHYLNDRFSCYLHARLRIGEVNSLNCRSFLSGPLSLLGRVEANNRRRFTIGPRA